MHRAFHTDSSKKTVQGASGISRQSFVRWKSRHATTMSIARQASRRWSLPSCRSSMRQPDPSVRWKTSMPHRRTYHPTTQVAFSRESTGSVVRSFHSSGATPSGGSVSVTTRAWRRTDGDPFHGPCSGAAISKLPKRTDIRAVRPGRPPFRGISTTIIPAEARFSRLSHRGGGIGRLPIPDGPDQEARALGIRGRLPEECVEVRLPVSHADKPGSGKKGLDPGDLPEACQPFFGLAFPVVLRRLARRIFGFGSPLQNFIVGDHPISS